MGGRFQRGKTGGISPFFAFQDIITSAMAVVITIVMLLALDMGEPSQGQSGEALPSNLKQKLTRLLDELSEANIRLRAAQNAQASGIDPAALKGEIATIQRELSGVQAAKQNSEKDFTKTKQDDVSKAALEDLEKQKAAITAVAKQVNQQEQECDLSLAKMKQSEAELRAIEGQFLAEQARKNQIHLIPERSATSKEPVLAIVSGESITLQRLDHIEKSELRGNKLLPQFDDAITAYSKLNQYIVFYFKPSGVKYFESLTKLAKNAGFEMGYDAIEEDIIIEFNSPR